MTKLSDGDYETLAGFRYALRRFGRYSEAAAQEAGLTPRQHEAAAADKRQVRLRLHQRGERVLEDLSQSHRAEVLRLRPMLQELLAGLG